MIAILIKAGYLIFPNELGVRLFPVLLTTASIYLIEKLIDSKNSLLFYSIWATLAIAQIGGIMAVPDTPLMFFVALFFYLYAQFTLKPRLLLSLLLGLCMALMMYTKYHAVLVILFTLVSNLKLLRNRYAYIAAGTSILLFLPHLYWQYQNGFPSLQFHFFERNSAGFEFKHTVEYILGQLLITGPIMGWFLVLAAARQYPRNALERAMKYTFVGIYLFFLISTLKGKAEANWTIPAFVGLVVLGHQYLNHHPRHRKLLYRMVPVTLLLVVAARVIMLVDQPPAWWMVKDEFHGNQHAMNAVKQKADNCPVIFLDTYQKPSKYWFYTGDTSFSLNTPTYRRNNFNFWDLESKYIGKPVYALNAFDKKSFPEKINIPRLENFGGTKVRHFYSFSHINCSRAQLIREERTTFTLSFETRTPADYLPLLKQFPYDTARVYLALYKSKKLLKYASTDVRVSQIDKEVQTHQANVTVNLPPGRYVGKFGVSTAITGYPSLNSPGFDVVIE